MRLALAIAILFSVSSRAQQSGRQLYEANCAGCHGLDARGGEHAPNIATIPKLQQMSDAGLVRTVRDGIPAAGMPAFRSRLSQQQLAAVAAFLRTLQAKVNSGAASPDTSEANDSNNIEAIVTMQDGTHYSGIVRNEDNFSIQLQDRDGVFHFLDKSEATSIKRNKIAVR